MASAAASLGETLLAGEAMTDPPPASAAPPSAQGGAQPGAPQPPDSGEVEMAPAADAERQQPLDDDRPPAHERAPLRGITPASSSFRADQTHQANEAVTMRKRTLLYLIYCFVFLALTGFVLVVSIAKAIGDAGRHVWNRTLDEWEIVCEAIICAALCTETSIALCRMGPRAFLRDRWRLFDAVVALLTLLSVASLLLRRVERAVADVAEDIDIPFLLLRFFVQPIRVFSTASMVVRAQRQHADAVSNYTLEPVRNADPRKPESDREGSLVTREMANELREMLPTHYMFHDWKLLYAPRVHGISINTFYRQQVGPTIMIMRTSSGILMGGFAVEPWRPELLPYGSSESFIFSSLRPVERHLAPPDERATTETTFEFWQHTGIPGKLVQWSDPSMFGFGSALVMREDFQRATSSTCSAFGTPAPLAAAGVGGELAIVDFECWGISRDRL